MEIRMKDLFQAGKEFAANNEKTFKREWVKTTKELHSLNIRWIKEFNYMVEFGFSRVFHNNTLAMDEMLTMLSVEWKKKFPPIVKELDIVLLITLCENIYLQIVSRQKAECCFQQQAVQYFFSKLLDHAMLTSQLEQNTEKWLKMMMTAKIAPVEWVAVLAPDDDEEEKQVINLVCREDDSSSREMISICEGIKGASVNQISVALKRLLDPGGEGQIEELKCLNDTLLLYAARKITRHERELIRKMYLRQIKMNDLSSKMEWKDASLLFMQRLLNAANAKEAYKSIARGFVDYLPFSRCALFVYSPYEQRGVGAYGCNVNHPSITRIKEDVRAVPLMRKFYKLLAHSAPIHIKDAKTVLPEKYIQEYGLKSFVAVPLYSPMKDRMMGLILIDRGENSDFTLSHQTMGTLIKFGQYSAECLLKFWEEVMYDQAGKASIISQREREVLKLIAEGASINEAARQLYLSSYTVRDYISAIIQKLQAKNRTEAVVKAVRMKLIN